MIDPRKHPVAVLALVEAFLALIVAFGFDITVEQMGALMAFTSSVLAVFAATRPTSETDLAH